MAPRTYLDFKKSTISWGLFIIAAFIVILFPLPTVSASSQHRDIVMEARQFAYSPAVLKVNRGDTVTIKLVSTDVVHGLYVDGYNVSVTADPGQSTSLSFVADKPGSFRLRCNVACGAMHPFMIGRLEVGANEWFYRSVGLAVLMVSRVYLNTRNKN
ncbi:MAG: cupredoxin domain-containing protein [Chloroflexota bacterium]|nr:MAG: hypothetical protein KatS3mg045_1460 [Bellilinea sp.]